MRKFVIAIAAIAALVLIGAVIARAAGQQAVSINTCVAKNGSLRVDDTCKSNETPTKFSPPVTTYRLAGQETIDVGRGTQFKVFCESGDVASGGGYVAGGPDVTVYESEPTSRSRETNTPTGWVVSARNEGTSPMLFTGWVVCQHYGQ